jgi:hypothetical protein
MLLDARPRVRWTEEEVAQAIEKQQRRAGPLVALVIARLEETWLEIRRELNEAAGGKASARVMVLAHHALRAQQALELTALLAEVAAGERDAGEKKGDPLNALRNQSGLSVIATQALNQAFEAAKAEAGKRESPTDQLMARLGHGGPKVTPVQGGSVLTHGSVAPPAEKGPTLSPDVGGAGGRIEATPEALPPVLPTSSGDSE